MNRGAWITRLIISASSLILMFACAHEGVAAQRALLQLGNFHQKVDLSYQLDSSQNQSGSIVRQFINESYNFDLDYGIYDPRILNGHFNATMLFSQQHNSGSDLSNSSGSGKQFQYSLSGKLYENSPIPLYFHASSGINVITPEFSRSYQVVTDNYGVSSLIKNKILPIELSYDRTLSSSAGLDQNFSAANDRFSFNATNDNNDTGRTELRLSANKDETDSGNVSSESRQYAIGLMNVNTFFKLSKPLGLSNSISFNEQGGQLYSKGLALSHGLTWSPGRALTLGMNYSFSNQAHGSLKDQFQKANIFMRHRLFASLETGMEVYAKKNDLSIGPEEETAGALNLKYNKLLPSASRLNIDFRQAYGVTSRAFSSGRVPVFGEAHTIDVNKLFFVQNLNAVSDSIVIRNADLLTQPLPYVQDVDFRITVIGAQTLISADLAGSRINAGDNLLITYEYQVDPQVRYATNSRGASSTLSLFSNKYRLYSSWQETYQTLLGGRGDTVNFSDHSFYQLGMGTQFDNGEFVSDYTSTVSNDVKQQSLYGMIRYGGRVGGGGYMLTANDRYSLITSSAVAGRAAIEQRTNRLSVSASYNTWLLNAISCLLATQYIMERGTLPRDNVSLSLRMSWRSGKLALSLLSQVFFRKSDSDWALEEHVRFDMTRYF